MKFSLHVFGILTFVMLLAPTAAAAQTKVEELSGWVVDIGKVETVAEGTKATQVVVPLPGMIAGTDLVIPEVIYDDNGVVLKSAEGLGPVELRGVNGFRIAAESYSFGPRGLQLNGVVYLPEALGGRGLRFPKGKVFLEPDGALIAEQTKLSVAWRNGALSAVSTSAEIGRAGLTLGRGAITVPGSSGLPFGAAQFRIDGSLVEAEGADGPASLEIQGLWFTGTSGFRISELRYTTNAGEEVASLQLSFAGELHLPAPFREASSYGEFVVENGGRVRYDDTGRGDFDFNHRGVEGHFSRPRFDSTDGFRLDQPELRLSSAMGGGSIRIDAALLTPRGQFDLYGFQTSPVDFWGLGVSFAKIGFTEKGFVGEDGYARLGEGVGSLTGFRVKSLRLNFDGTLEQSALELSDRYLEISDTLALDNASLSAGQTTPGTPLVLALSGTLGLPTALGDLRQVTVLRLPLDRNRQRFAFEQLESAPVVFEQGGLQFDLVFRGVNEAGAYLFQGHAKVVEKASLVRWPSTAPSGYLVSEFTLGADGTLTAVFLVPGHVSPFTARYDGGWVLGQGL